MIAALLLPGVAPCFSSLEASARCPMAHCDRPASDTLAVPSCCCAPAGTPASESRTPAVVAAAAPTVPTGPLAPTLAATCPRAHESSPAPSAVPVPLYLLHSTFLI